ncbi:MAG: DM13 domain-containing protein [Chloroflexia bacterium]
MSRRIWVVVAVVVLAVMLPVGWYLASPLFIDRRVGEEFPVAAVATGTAILAVPAAAAIATERPTATPTVPQPTPTPEPTALPTGTAVPSGPANAQTVATMTPTPRSTATPTLPPVPTATATPAPPPPPAGPVVVGSGQFTVVDTIHKGVGTATIYQLADGRRILRLEGFSVTNGPDLFVYLSGHPEPRSAGELHETADFEIARLKGNVGDQNYELPPDLDLGQFRSVVIYCKRFTTVFSTATLGAGRQAGGGVVARSLQLVLTRRRGPDDSSGTHGAASTERNGRDDRECAGAGDAGRRVLLVPGGGLSRVERGG